MSEAISTLPDDDILTVAQIARHLKTSQATVYNIIKVGKLARLKKVGPIRVKRAVYIDFLKD